MPVHLRQPILNTLYQLEVVLSTAVPHEVKKKEAFTRELFKCPG